MPLSLANARTAADRIDRGRKPDGVHSAAGAGLRRKHARSGDRRADILLAAQRLFLERGYAATSTAAILKISGGSKQTFYELFGDKAGLFRAVIESITVAVLTTIEESALDPADPPVALRRIGIEFLSMWISPRSLGLIRLVIAEGRRIPEICEIVVRSGSKEPEAALAAYLARCRTAGTLTVDVPETLANAFISLLVSPVLTALFTQRPFTPATVERHVDKVLPYFLRACEPPALIPRVPPHGATPRRLRAPGERE